MRKQSIINHTDLSNNKFSKKNNYNIIQSVPDWKSYMTTPGNQTCGNCWAFAATGVTEGLLQYQYGSNIGINLDEDWITDYSQCGSCSGGSPYCALSYIQNNRCISDQSLSSFPNLSNTYWGLKTISSNTLSVDGIKSSLQYSPVLAVMYVFSDLYSYSSGIYKHTTGTSVGYHAIVIVGYDNTQNYWVCKNSWGTNWGEGGFFKIAFGECEIEMNANYTASVDESCFGKIVPDLITSLNTAINYNFANNEMLYAKGTSSLSGNLSISSGKHLTLLSTSNTYLGNYNIISNGGSIIINNGAYLNGLKAYLKSGSTVIGYCPSIQNAINNASTNQSVELLSTAYSESPSFSSKSNITLYGQGQGSTTLNGSISVTNSSYITISDLTMSNSLSENNSTWTRFYNATISGTTIANNYGGTMTEIGFVSASNIAASFGVSAYGGTGDFYDSQVSNGDCAVYLTNSASYNVGSDNTFCSNGLDIYVTGGAYAYAISNLYSRPLPSSISGNIFVTGQNGVCSSPKAIVVNNDQPAEQISPELKAIDEEYLTLLRKIHKDKEDNKYDAKNYTQDYQQLIDAYKKLVNTGKDKDVIKAALSKISDLYNGQGDKMGLSNYIAELLSIGNLKTYEPYIKRYNIWNYVDNKDYSNSLKTADEVLSSANADQDLQAEMLYEKGLIYKYYLGDKGKANDMYASIISKYPASPLTIFASNEMGIKPDYSFKKAASGSNQNDKPAGYELNNYPNPFNPTTVISFNLKEKDHVTIIVFDILGKEVARLIDGIQLEGEHSISFDGSNLPSGMYIYQLKGSNFNITKKMLLLK